jgi:hypothetical protein
MLFDTAPPEVVELPHAVGDLKAAAICCWMKLCISFERPGPLSPGSMTGRQSMKDR